MLRAFMFLIFLTACAPSTLQVLNKTGEPLTTVALLKEEEQSNLTYNLLEERNLLKAPLSHDSVITVKTEAGKKSGITNLLGISENYNYFLQYNVKGRRLVLDKSHHFYSEGVVAIGSEGSKYQYQIENKSPFTIYSVIAHFEKGKTSYNTLVSMPWNVIRPGEIKLLEFYDYDPYNRTKVVKLELVARKNNGTVTQTFTSDLDKPLVFDKK